MHCPACNRLLRSLTISGVSVDMCERGCGGVWLDQGELGAFDSLSDATISLLLKIPVDPVIRVNLNDRRRCPRCSNVVLMRHFFSPTRAVTIDECPVCGGIWLDHGEFERIHAEQAFSPDERRRAAQRVFEETALDDRMRLLGGQIGADLNYDTSRSRIASVALVALYMMVASTSVAGKASLLLSLAFSVLSRVFSSDVGPSRILTVCALPLACIWFPDALGSMVEGRFASASPRSLVWTLGWILLALPVVVATIFLIAGVNQSPFK